MKSRILLCLCAFFLCFASGTAQCPVDVRLYSVEKERLTIVVVDTFFHQKNASYKWYLSGPHGYSDTTMRGDGFRTYTVPSNGQYKLAVAYYDSTSGCRDTGRLTITTTTTGCNPTQYNVAWKNMTYRSTNNEKSSTEVYWEVDGQRYDSTMLFRFKPGVTYELVYTVRDSLYGCFNQTKTTITYTSTDTANCVDQLGWVKGAFEGERRFFFRPLVQRPAYFYNHNMYGEEGYFGSFKDGTYGVPKIFYDTGTYTIKMEAKDTFGYCSYFDSIDVKIGLYEVCKAVVKIQYDTVWNAWADLSFYSHTAEQHAFIIGGTTYKWTPPKMRIYRPDVSHLFGDTVPAAAGPFWGVLNTGPCRDSVLIELTWPNCKASYGTAFNGLDSYTFKTDGPYHQDPQQQVYWILQGDTFPDTTGELVVGHDDVGNTFSLQYLLVTEGCYSATRLTNYSFPICRPRVELQEGGYEEGYAVYAVRNADTADLFKWEWGSDSIVVANTIRLDTTSVRQPVWLVVDQLYHCDYRDSVQVAFAPRCKGWVGVVRLVRDTLTPYYLAIRGFYSADSVSWTVNGEQVSKLRTLIYGFDAGTWQLCARLHGGCDSSVCYTLQIEPYYGLLVTTEAPEPETSGPARLQLLAFNKIDSLVVEVETRDISMKGNIDSFAFSGLYRGSYMVRLVPLIDSTGSDSLLYYGSMPTYYGGAMRWTHFQPVDLFSDTFAHAHVGLRPTTSEHGPGTLRVHAFNAFGAPAPSVSILLTDKQGGPVAARLTDGKGEASFDSLPIGDFVLYGDVPGKRIVHDTFSIGASSTRPIEATVTEKPDEVVAQVKLVSMPDAPKTPQVSAFPNPTSGLLTLLLPDDLEGRATISLTDMAGRTVLYETRPIAPTMQVDFSALANGLYLLRVHHPDFQGRALISKM